MKFNFFILTQLFFVLFFIGTAQSCSNTQQAENPSTDLSVTNEASNDSKQDGLNPEETTAFKFISKAKLPSEIEYVENMCVSMFKLFILQENKVYVLNPKETDKIIAEFSLVDTEGKTLEGINMQSKIEYAEDLKQLFVLTEKSVYRFDDEGKYLGELPSPSSNFKPTDIAFDLYREGSVYVLSKAEIVGEIFLWENVEQAPRSIIKGDAVGLEIYSIEYGFRLDQRSLNILASSTLTDAIYEYSENTESQWNETGIIDKSNQVNLGGLLSKVKSNHFNLFVLGDFNPKDGSSIKISKKGGIDREENLWAGEIKDFPKETYIDQESAKRTIIKNFGFYRSYTLFILSNGQLFLFKQEQ